MTEPMENQLNYGEKRKVSRDNYISPEVGQIVLCDGKRIGEMVLIEEPDNFGIKIDNSEWSVNLDFFMFLNGESNITVIPKGEYHE